MRPVSVVILAIAILGTIYWLRRGNLVPDDDEGPLREALGLGAPGGGGGSATVSIPGGVEGAGKFTAPPPTAPLPKPDPAPLTPPTAPPAQNGAPNPYSIWDAILNLRNPPPAETKQGHEPTETTVPPAGADGGSGTGGSSGGGGSGSGKGGQGYGGNKRKAYDARERYSDGSRRPVPERQSAAYAAWRAGGKATAKAPTLKGASGPLLPGQKRGTKQTAQKGAGSKGYAAYVAYGRTLASPAKTPAQAKARKPKPGKTADEIQALLRGYRGY